MSQRAGTGRADQQRGFRFASPRTWVRRQSRAPMDARAVATAPPVAGEVPHPYFRDGDGRIHVLL